MNDRMPLGDFFSRVHLLESNGPAGILKREVEGGVVGGIAGDDVVGRTAPCGAGEGAAGTPTPGGAMARGILFGGA